MSATKVVVLTISDLQTGVIIELIGGQKGVHCFVGICITLQVLSEVIMGEMIKEVPDSYTDEGDVSDKFWIK